MAIPSAIFHDIKRWLPGPLCLLNMRSYKVVPDKKQEHGAGELRSTELRAVKRCVDQSAILSHPITRTIAKIIPTPNNTTAEIIPATKSQSSSPARWVSLPA